MTSQSQDKSNIGEDIDRDQSQQQMENILKTLDSNSNPQNSQMQDSTQCNSSASHQNIYMVEAEVKLFIGQDVYKRRQKVCSYEELQQIALALLKNHHLKIEGKVAMKYQDLEQDRVHLNDQLSYETAVEEILNSSQKTLKVFAELVQLSDNKLPNLSHSFSYQQGLNCSNCSSFNLQFHPNESVNNLEYLNQIISRNNSQNSSNQILTTSLFVNPDLQCQVLDQIEQKDAKPQKQIGIMPQGAANKVHSPIVGKSVSYSNQDSQKLEQFRQLKPQSLTENHKNQSFQNFDNIQHEEDSYNLLISQDQQIVSPKSVNQNQLNLLNRTKNSQQQSYQYLSNQQQQSQQQQRHIPPHPFQIPYQLQAMLLNQFDPSYQQFLIFKEYFQNVMNHQNPMHMSGAQNEMDQLQKKNLLYQLGGQIHSNGKNQSNSLQNYQEILEPNQQNHRYSNSLNSLNTYKNNQLNNPASFSTDFTQKKQNLKKDFAVNTSLDESIHQHQQRQNMWFQHQQQIEKQKSQNQNQIQEQNANLNQQVQNNVDPEKRKDQFNDQKFHQNGMQSYTYVSKIAEHQNQNIENRKNFESYKNSMLNESFFKNQIQIFNEQEINIDDLDSVKSQKADDSNSFKIEFQKKPMNGGFVINSTDSDQTARENSGNSNYYNEIQQNQQIGQQDTYQNISQVDCFSLNTSKEDKNIPSLFANNLYLFDSPTKIQQTRQFSPLKSQNIENQSKVNLDNQKAVSQSVQQNIFQSNQIESISKDLQMQKANDYDFQSLIEQSIVIQKSKDDRENNIPQYFQTLKQIQKKTVEELKKDPNCTQCVQEMLSNEKCRFCKKNLICKYKDKQKLIMTVVSHKIKEILPYLRPIIEKQIQKRKNIRAFSYNQQDYDQLDHQKSPCHIAKSENINKTGIKNQEHQVSSSVPPKKLDDISFNQSCLQNSPQSQILGLLQKNSDNQSSDRKLDHKQIDSNKNIFNDYTFQNLNDLQFMQGGNNHCYSFGSNHKSPKNSLSFDKKSGQEKSINSQNGEQKLHSFNEFPDEQYMQGSNLLSPNKNESSQEEENNYKQLYANFQKQTNLFNPPQPSKFLLGNQLDQLDFFNGVAQIQKNEMDLLVQNDGLANQMNQIVPMKRQVSEKTAAFNRKVEMEYQIYDDLSNEEEESKDDPKIKFDKKGKIKQKHELTQPYQVEIAEYSLNQTINCYPGERRDILIEVRNAGKKNWDINNFYLKCTKGVFENQKFPPSQKLGAGSFGSIHLQVKIPKEIKTYTTHWQMCEIKSTSWEKEFSFGPVIKIQFVVREPVVNNPQFWQEVKNQLYQLIDPNENNIEKKIHDFIKSQQGQYNHQQISQAKQGQLIDKIISQYFDHD